MRQMISYRENRHKVINRNGHSNLSTKDIAQEQMGFENFLLERLRSGFRRKQSESEISSQRRMELPNDYNCAKRKLVGKQMCMLRTEPISFQDYLNFTQNSSDNFKCNVEKIFLGFLRKCDTNHFLSFFFSFCFITIKIMELNNKYQPDGQESNKRIIFSG